MPRERRKLAGILAADVVGYSRLMASDESGTLSQLRMIRTEHLEPKIQEFDGRLVGSAGDSVLVEFASVVDAVQCAVEIQARLADLNAPLSEDKRMDFRIGVNLGDVIEDESTIYGNGVNVAARLEKLAKPGTVCIAGSVYDLTQAKLPYRFIDLGEQHVHNIPVPVRAYLISPDSNVQDRATHKALARPADRTTIAVLPFANMSSDPGQDYFADGLADDLITELSRYRQLSVVSRDSTYVYKGKTVRASDVRQELGADFLVEGSIRQSGNRIRVAVKLIDADNNAQVLAERFDRNVEDIFDLQDEIAGAVASKLSFGLVEAAAEQRRRSPTTSITAYDRFLQAEAAWRKGDEATAMNTMAEAVKLDPNYARALGEIAFFYSYSIFTGSSGLAEGEIIRRVHEFSRRAIAADKADPFTLMTVACAYLMVGEHKLARINIEAAAKQNPRDMEIMNIRGQTLSYSGSHQEGLAILERVNSSEPRLPTGYRIALSDAYFLARNYHGALAALDMITDPPPIVHLCRVPILAHLGRIDEAKRELGLSAGIPGTPDPAFFARRAALQCARQEDRDHYFEGYRKAGVPV
jgi:adenylate cyclase